MQNETIILLKEIFAAALPELYCEHSDPQHPQCPFRAAAYDLRRHKFICSLHSTYLNSN